MKKEDLMIGDWVLFVGSKYQIQKEDFSANYVFEPIPLTEEILDKNGFKKVEKDLFHFGQSSISVDTWFGIDNNVIYWCIILWWRKHILQMWICSRTPTCTKTL